MQKKTSGSSKKVKSVEIGSTNNISLLEKINLDIKPKNDNQKLLVKSIKQNDITVCTGAPGVGKTFLSCAQALSELKNNDKIKKIVLIKSVTQLKGEDLGYLKGDLNDKLEPTMYSFVGNFEKIIGKELYDKLIHEQYIVIKPISFLRGVNLDNSIVLIDEAQNITIENIKTILTRLGENSKMVFLGDLKQIDIRDKSKSALRFLIDNFNGIKGFGTIEFTKEDIIRHPLIKIIEEIFDKLEEEEFLKRNKKVIID